MASFFFCGGGGGRLGSPGSHDITYTRTHEHMYVYVCVYVYIYIYVIRMCVCVCVGACCTNGKNLMDNSRDSVVGVVSTTLQ